MPTIQPQTLAVELTSATVHISTENTALARAAAAPPQANVTGAQLRNAVGYVAITAALIGLTPVWYAAFPVTIPASVAATALFDVVIHAFGGTITRPEGLTPLGGSGLAGGWAVGPLYLVKKSRESDGQVPQFACRAA